MNSNMMDCGSKDFNLKLDSKKNTEWAVRYLSIHNISSCTAKDIVHNIIQDLSKSISWDSLSGQIREELFTRRLNWAINSLKEA